MESAVGPGRSSVDNVDVMKRALEQAGVVFTNLDEQAALGAGVSLKG